MKKNVHLLRVFAVCSFLAALVAVQQWSWGGAADLPSGHPAPGGGTAPDRFTGKVVETMDAAGYTYVLADDGREKVWAAASRFEVKVGEQVSFSRGMPMANFHSRSLDRDFPMIYFTGRIEVEGRSAAAAPGAGQLPPGHPEVKPESAVSQPDLTGIKKARGGRTIEEIFKDKDALAGKEIKVRGRVVKFSRQIMGRNWIHIQDGTGKKGADDLTVTTQSEAGVGDLVLITGQVALNRDFGQSYQYPVLVEEARVTVETPRTAAP